MHSYKKQENPSEQVNSTNEIELLREQVEFLQELLEGTKQEHSYIEQQLQATQQELNSTNSELADALTVETKISLFEAKKVARTLIKNQKCTEESLAALISAIYNTIVMPKELSIEIPGRRKMPLKSGFSNDIVAQSKQIKAVYDEMRSDFIKLENGFMENKTQIINEASSKLEKSINEDFENSYLSCSSPPPILLMNL